MKILGHTLGTPGLDIPTAIELFARSGLDGIEVIWQDGYRCAIPETDGRDAAVQAKKHAQDAGLIIGCLTPYVTDINSTDAELREQDVKRLEKAIELAAELECQRIRVYGGRLIGDEPEDVVTARWQHLVESLHHLGTLSQRMGVNLAVENHFSTMTVSAAQTAQLVAEVSVDSVGALYDQANLAFTHQEDYTEAIKLQADIIKHVHVKDLEFIDPDRHLRTGDVASIADEDRVHRSRMIGDGILNWSLIIESLVASGYDGTYSLEYEYRWNPDDLPAPEIGFPESGRRLREVFHLLSDARIAA